MTSPHPTSSSETTLTQDLVNAVRYYLGGRRGLIIIATVTVIAGLALNWSWLVAAGIAARWLYRRLAPRAPSEPPR